MARWTDMDAWLKRQGIRVGTATLGQTTGGVHASGSYHYLGQARDYGLYNCDCAAIARAFEPLAKGRNYVIVELIWTPATGRGIYYKAGNAYTPTQKLANGHRDHVHAAITANGHLPPIASGDPPVTQDEINRVANLAADKVLERLTPGSKAHPNFGDVINDLIIQLEKRGYIKKT